MTPLRFSVSESSIAVDFVMGIPDLQGVSRQSEAAFHIEAGEVHADFVQTLAIREVEHQDISVSDGGISFHPPYRRFGAVFQEIEVFVHPCPEAQFVYHDEVARLDGGRHRVAGNGVEINDKQPECNRYQQRDEDCRKVLQGVFDGFFHGTFVGKR